MTNLDYPKNKDMVAAAASACVHTRWKDPEDDVPTKSQVINTTGQIRLCFAEKYPIDDAEFVEVCENVLKHTTTREDVNKNESRS